MSSPKRPPMPGDLFDLPIDGRVPDDDGSNAIEEEDQEDALTEVDDGHLDDTRSTSASERRPLPLFDDDQGSAPQPPARRSVPSSERPTSPSGIFDQLPDPRQQRRGTQLPLEAAPATADPDSLPAADSESPADGLDPAMSASDDESAARHAAGFLVRLQAGAADLLAHLAVLSGSLLGMRFLGLRPDIDQWPGFVAFLALFSFLYLAFPLAFWGQSPGMAWFGLVARDTGDRPLAFGQTGLRVLASWLTVALGGLPLLLALTRRSLGDRMSGSQTWIAEVADSGE